MYIRTVLILIAVVPALASAGVLTIHDTTLSCGDGSQLRIETTIGGCKDGNGGNDHDPHDTIIRVYRDGSLHKTYTYPVHHLDYDIKKVNNVPNSGSHSYQVKLHDTYTPNDRLEKGISCSTSSTSTGATVTPSERSNDRRRRERGR